MTAVPYRTDRIVGKARRSVRGVSIFHVENGQIARYTEYWDAYGFLIQLGALPPPATPAP